MVESLRGHWVGYDYYSATDSIYPEETAKRSTVTNLATEIARREPPHVFHQAGFWILIQKGSKPIHISQYGSVRLFDRTLSPLKKGVWGILTSNEAG